MNCPYDNFYQMFHDLCQGLGLLNPLLLTTSCVQNLGKSLNRSPIVLPEKDEQTKS